jgi:CheY-like chemotaxis protein
MKLLLIEDEDFIRDLYKRQLELAGIPTDAFGMGNDGLNAAHQNPTAYDLVLLDIMLPDTNGLQILKDLKQNTPTKSIPVILLTNLSQDMLIKEGFELGAEGYLVKAAYTPAQIVQEVKNILAKKPTNPVAQSPNPIAVDQNTPVLPQAAPTTPSTPPEPTPTIEQPVVTPIAPVEVPVPPVMDQIPSNLPVGTPPPMSNPLGNSTPVTETTVTETTTTTTDSSTTEPIQSTT